MIGYAVASVVLLASVWLPRPIVAQTVARIDVVRSEVFVGSELEQYLRVLQTIGEIPTYPWSIRGFSRLEVDHLTASDEGNHPWAQRYDFPPKRRSSLRFDIVRPELSGRYNSAYPYGGNDGAIWAGRGLTTSLTAGIAADWGPVSLTLAPVVFRAENRAFALMPNGFGGALAYADGRFPLGVDRPQRFGDAPYGRVDPGQSSLRVDAFGTVVGMSTANQWWGPASQFPFLLGNNAPGYLHLFTGTARPRNVWIGTLHGRLVWGELDQSDYSSVTGHESRRFMSGMIGVLSPHFAAGLEIGGARFFHSAWPVDGIRLRHVLKPLEGLLKRGLDFSNDPGRSGDPKQDDQNQLGSVFARWVLPRSGFEVYVEYGREDHSWDLRDLIVEPEHSRSYVLGFRKVWPASASRLTSLRAELMQNQPSGTVRRREGGGTTYAHSQVRQGHTHRGQLLGADLGVGSSAAGLLALDRHDETGRWTLSWRRVLRQEEGRFLETGVQNARAMEVSHSLTLERLIFLGALELTGGLTGVYDLNRYSESDAFNVNAVVAGRIGVRSIGGQSRH